MHDAEEFEMPMFNGVEEFLKQNKYIILIEHGGVKKNPPRLGRPLKLCFQPVGFYGG